MGSVRGVLKRERLAHWDIPLPFYTILYRETNPPPLLIFIKIWNFTSLLLSITPTPQEHGELVAVHFSARQFFLLLFRDLAAIEEAGKRKTFIKRDYCIALQKCRIESQNNIQLMRNTITEYLGFILHFIQKINKKSKVNRL